MLRICISCRSIQRRATTRLMKTSEQMSYIGCKLSLLSNMDVRYEGILCAVNIEECSVALTKVRCFGTEDRPTTNRVAALDDIFEYIIFKSSDIKDLYVCEAPKPMSQFNDGLPNDPAILSASQQRTTDRPNTSSSAALDFDTPKAAAHGMMRGQGDGPIRLTYKDDGMKSSANSIMKKMMSRKERSTFESDYDFVKANEQFEHALSHLSDDFHDMKFIGESSSTASTHSARKGDTNGDTQATKEEERYYDKSSSFFDSISCDSLQKQNGKQLRTSWRKEFETNKETFGLSAVRSYASRRGRNYFLPTGANLVFTNSAGFDYNGQQRRGTGRSGSCYRSSGAMNL
uniref:FFD domain-containing protein n=1 Tax=Ascaris lumbricoides TaxID=6252 RepID=A0A0M3I581_ASCLU